MSTEVGKTYLEFASKVSFFEFGEGEFKKSGLDISSFEREIEILESRVDWNIDTLSDYVKEHPRSFRVFEGIFQLMRFTDAQMIHFIFDVSKLNLADIEALYVYAIYNLKHDEFCRNLFLDKISEDVGRRISYEEVTSNEVRFAKQLVVAIFKMAVSDYAEAASKEFAILERRITKKEFSDFSVRFANYLLGTLELNRMLKGIKISDFLSAKLIPADTKGLHGKFLKSIVQTALEHHGYKNIDSLLKKHNISVLRRKIETQVNPNELPGERLYCTEKYVEGIEKPNDGGAKKFDIILISALMPKHVFELNFYTTEGTKIGINEEEYLALHISLNKQNNVKFHWITDGSYWLSTQGRRRFERLYPLFGSIYNANTFVEHLSDFV